MPRAPSGFWGPPVTKDGNGPSRSCSPAVGVHDGHSAMRPIAGDSASSFEASSPTVMPSVADRLTLRQNVIEELVVHIDDDAARRFLARVVDDVPAIVLRNISPEHRQQFRHQRLVAARPSSLRRRLKRFLHAAAEQQAQTH